MLVGNPPKPRVYTQEEWAEKRSAFEGLYSQGITLAAVRELMVINHEFYATEAQYKKKIKAWGLERNIDKATALGILRKESKRKYVEDKETIFEYKGGVVGKDKMTFLNKRYKGVLDHNGLGSDPRLWETEQADTPPHVSYFTPPPVDEPPSVDYEILNHQVGNGASGAALDCGETLENKTQYGSSIKEAPSRQQGRVRGPFNTWFSVPLIPGLEDQPIEINSSPDGEGNGNIELDVDPEDNGSWFSRPSLDLFGDGSGNNKEYISLHEAAYQGRIEIVIWLLEQDYSVAERDGEKRTALHRATSGGHEKMVQLLLYNGADASAKCSDGKTALHLAASDGHERIVQLLLQNGVDTSAKISDGITALHMAASGGHEKVVRLLLRHGVDASSTNIVGETALHMAASDGHEKVVQSLLQSCVDASLKSHHGSTALHLAACNGHEKVVQSLLQSGVDASLKDGYGWTALHIAERYNYKEVSRILSKARDSTSSGKVISNTRTETPRVRDGKESQEVEQRKRRVVHTWRLDVV